MLLLGLLTLKHKRSVYKSENVRRFFEQFKVKMAHNEKDLVSVAVLGEILRSLWAIKWIYATKAWTILII